jgi:DNA-directed RNA polymerase specialized sigma24 family protein
MTREKYGEAYEQGLEHTVRFLLSRGIKRDAALDVAQAAWVRGWERLDQLRDEKVLVTWVNTIALNQFRRSLRHDRYEPLVDFPDPQSSLNWAAIELSRIMSRCRPRDRVLLKAQLEGRTAGELSEGAGSTPTAMRLRLYRARTAARMVTQKFLPRPAFAPQLAVAKAA